MSIVLSHISALEYHRFLCDSANSFTLSLSTATHDSISRRQAATILQSEPTLEEIVSLRETYSESLSQPLHLLVCNSNKHIARKHAVCHRAPKTMPRGPFIQASQAFGVQSFYACSVPFALSQIANETTPGTLAKLCCEMSGTYRQNENTDNSVVFNRLPITSITCISDFAKRHPSLYGCPRLAQVTNYLSGQSASPLETALAIMLGFPTRWGGYGLPVPQLNYQVFLTQTHRQELDKQFCVGDLVWPSEKVILEYDSDMFHTGHERISKDAQRRNALIKQGYTIITATSDQVFNAYKTDRLATDIAKLLGKRLRCSRTNYRQAKNQLRRDLLQGK